MTSFSLSILSIKHVISTASTESNIIKIEKKRIGGTESTNTSDGGRGTHPRGAAPPATGSTPIPDALLAPSHRHRPVVEAGTIPVLLLCRKAATRISLDAAHSQNARRGRPPSAAATHALGLSPSAAR
jgi:hypothetical protein